MLALLRHWPVRGTSEWKKYELTLDVPSEAVNIAFGAIVAGKGQAWVDDYSFEVVGNDVPLTIEAYPKQPANLNFEN